VKLQAILIPIVLAGCATMHDHRVVRGGMWGSSPANVRLARRFKDPNDVRSQGTGFRVARTMGP
jgi:formylglycine-generating enzyme required for sulfatase activity